MSLTAILNPIASLNVGTGGSASGAHPVVEVTESATPEGREGQSGVETRMTRLSVTCLAEAADEAALGSTVETLRAAFTKRGERVELVQHSGTARVFAAGDGSAATLRGYPVCAFTRIESGAGYESKGTLIVFRVDIDVRETVAADDPVSHRFTITESQDEFGRVTTRQRGTVRTLNGTNAKTWTQTNVTTVAAAAATANNETFLLSFTSGADTSAIEYEFTRAEPSPGDFGFSVINAETASAVQQRPRGVFFVVRGFAVGDEATEYAEAQRPTVAAQEKLVRERVADPRDPDGRVDFEYELIRGFDSTDFPGIKVLTFRRETAIAQVGGRAISAATFAERDPILWRGEVRPWAYRESLTLEYLDDEEIDWPTVDALDPSMDTDQMFDERARHGFTAEGARVLTIERSYLYTTEQTVPDPLILINPALDP